MSMKVQQKSSPPRKIEEGTAEQQERISSSTPGVASLEEAGAGGRPYGRQFFFYAIYSHSKLMSDL